MPLVHPGLCAVSSAYVRRYFVVNELKTRTEAQRHCRENYMDLATIRDSEDLETLKTLKATFHSVSFMLSVTGGLNVVHLQSWKVCRRTGPQCVLYLSTLVQCLCIL
ncbi:hypothetical protein EYF80_063265 [Liparis tanakae]|uniref:C-type lectin domain-containing protein n=1 Tax=Liparis tanakae TaxID=230148 RepID=A0A4Z2ECP0_9TELE|nr:hypothetical protein EYF80_063265 [Liparis tanakae]